MKVPLPQTVGRLSQSCYLYCTGGGNTSLTNAVTAFLTSNDLQANSSVDPVATFSTLLTLLGASKPLGEIDNLVVRQTREVERVYAIGANAFDPYRMVPKSVQTTLELEKVVIYDKDGGDLLAAFGFNPWNIYYQQSPVIIRQDLDTPGGEDPISNIYLDCWITELPTTFDLTSENGNLVKQRATMYCGRVLSSASIYSNLNTKAGSNTTVNKKNVKFY